MLVARTADLLCPLALSDMSYSGIDTSPAPTASSNSGSSSEGSQVLLIIVIIMAVAMVSVCALVFVMYTKEKAGEPIFKPLVDMDAIVPNIEEEKKGPSEVAMAVVSK